MPVWAIVRKQGNQNSHIIICQDLLTIPSKSYTLEKNFLIKKRKKRIGFQGLAYIYEE